VNEFSDPRAVYVFTAAIPSSQLPPLRCSGAYVLQVGKKSAREAGGFLRDAITQTAASLRERG
jgi:hypothetical protein